MSRAPHRCSDVVLVSAGFLLLASSQPLYFLSGVLIMGVAHAVITVKGTHLASHGALSESPAWADFWAVFFIEVRFAADETLLNIVNIGKSIDTKKINYILEEKAPKVSWFSIFT